jgi:hypothetical protein
MNFWDSERILSEQILKYINRKKTVEGELHNELKFNAVTYLELCVFKSDLFADTVT